MYCLFCVVLCIVCVYICTELLPPGGYPISAKYIISLSNRTIYNDFSKALLALENFIGNCHAVCKYGAPVLDTNMATRLANLRG